MTVAGLPDIAGAQLIGFMLVLARVGGLFVLAPVFSSRTIPMRAKVIAASAISLALTPLATAGGSVATDPIVVSSLLIKELTVGLGFALSIAVLTAAVQYGASLLDTLVGFSFGAIVDPFSQVQSAPIAQLYSLFAAMVFLVSGGDRMMIMGLARSYELVPLGATPDTARLASLATDGLVTIGTIGVSIAAPVAVALIVTDVALGLISRAVPQLNVFFVGAPGKIIVAVFVIAASLPFVAFHLAGNMQDAVMHGLAGLRTK